MADWQILKKQIVHQNPWFYIEKILIKRPDGSRGPYFILKRFNPFIVSIIQDKQGKIVLIKQFRPPLMAETWELPMGAINKNEQPIKAAQRELGEETGLQASNWQKIGEFYIAVGHTDQRGLVFLGHNPQKTNKRFNSDEGEIISRVRGFSLAELVKQIENGKIKDGPTMSALFLAKKYLKEHK